MVATFNDRSEVLPSHRSNAYSNDRSDDSFGGDSVSASMVEQLKFGKGSIVEPVSMIDKYGEEERKIIKEQSRENL